jgi:hypothetical protein
MPCGKKSTKQTLNCVSNGYTGSDLKPIFQDKRASTVFPTTDIAVKIFIWTVFVLMLLNTLYFAIRTSSPVIQQDGWYFFDAFLKKAIQGNLTLGDFFVKRAGADHSQPLFKLEMLIEWRFFGLDFSLGAVIGVLAAAVCALRLYKVTVTSTGSRKTDLRRGLAWACICALFLSLNADGATWTWPLVALENVTTLIIVLFMAAVWTAYERERYWGVVFFTFFLSVTSDDSAMLAVIATLAALVLMHACDKNKRKKSTWKILLVVIVIIIIVRAGYIYAPVKSGLVAPSMLSNFGKLARIFFDGGWWMWVVLPLSQPVYHQRIAEMAPGIWVASHIMIAAALLAAHIFFWRRALRTEYSSATFIAVCLMFIFYEWVLGIIVSRVTMLGNGYLNEPRYISLYAYGMIALLIMWSDSKVTYFRSDGKFNFIGSVLPVAGCLFLLALQIPMSIKTWQRRPYQLAYDAEMASQIEQMTLHPSAEIKCLPEQYAICSMSPKRRQELSEILRSGRLNIFSPQVQRRHRYLPKLP